VGQRLYEHAQQKQRRLEAKRRARQVPLMALSL
jgi:hypothetical protein